MNTSLRTAGRRGRTLLAAAVALALTSCATAPLSPEGSAAVRTKLTQLQNDPTLGSLAPVAIKEAESAVVVAEEPLADAALGAHRVYIADRKVDIAIAQASTRHAEDQQATIGEQRDRARLDARTREADAAHIAATDAAAQAAELQRQIDALQAEATDRGLVLTLGDVLFASGRAELKIGATNNLDKLVAFLNNYPNRSVVIEGHTDNQGSDDYNMGLSERRADSVKSYLMEQGISSQRLVASGKGETQPLADNESESGRQQNRRVEVIIENAPLATASTSM
jgi:outer membrane protein OmpA-like peptidoglycan-associated protein